MIRCNEIKYRKKQNFVSFPTTSIQLGNPELLSLAHPDWARFFLWGSDLYFRVGK
jgi:hypothetical protein